MLLLTLLSNKLKHYPKIKLSEIESLINEKEEGLLGYQQDILGIKQCMSELNNDDIDVSELAKAWVTENPSVSCLHFYMTVLNEYLTLENNPIELLFEIETDAPGIFASIIILLIQENIKAKTIIESGFLSRWFINNFIDIAAVESSYDLLEEYSKSDFLTPNQQEKLNKFLLLASETALDLSGVGNYTLDGKQSSQIRTTIPYNTAKIKYNQFKKAPTLDFIRSVQALFDIDLGELEKAMSETMQLTRKIYASLEPGSPLKHSVLIDFIQKQKEKPSLALHYLFLECIPKISDEALLTLYSNPSALNADFPIRVVAPYLTPHQMEMIFSEGDLWYKLGSFYPAEDYITDKMKQRIISEDITLQNVKQVVHAALNEPGLASYQEALLHKAFIFLYDHGYHYQFNEVYQWFKTYPKSYEWAMSLNESLTTALKVLIQSEKQFDSNRLKSFEYFKHGQVKMMVEVSDRFTFFPTYLDNSRPLMAFIIETHFDETQPLSTLLKSLFQCDEMDLTQDDIIEALHLCLASTQSIRLQLAIIEYLENDLNIKNWVQHITRRGFTFIEMVMFYQNASLFDNHMLDSYFSEKSRRIIIDKLRKKENLFDIFPMLWFDEYPDIVDEILFCNPNVKQSKFFEIKSIARDLIVLLVKCEALMVAQNNETGENILKTLAILLSNIPESQRLNVITEPVFSESANDYFTLIELAVDFGATFASALLKTIPKNEQFNAFKINNDVMSQQVIFGNQRIIDFISDSFNPDVLNLIHRVTDVYRATALKYAIQEKRPQRFSFFSFKNRIQPLPDNFLEKLYDCDKPEETVKFIYDFLNTPYTHRWLRESILFGLQHDNLGRIPNSEYELMLNTFRETILNEYDIDPLPDIDPDFYYIPPIRIPWLS